MKKGDSRVYVKVRIVGNVFNKRKDFTGIWRSDKYV